MGIGEGYVVVLVIKKVKVKIVWQQESIGGGERVLDRMVGGPPPCPGTILTLLFILMFHLELRLSHPFVDPLQPTRHTSLPIPQPSQDVKRPHHSILDTSVFFPTLRMIP